MEMPKKTKNLTLNHSSYRYWDIASLGRQRVRTLPYSLRVLLENLVRSHGEKGTPAATVETFFNALQNGQSCEFPFYPARVLMQDFTGVPAVADLCALRDAMVDANADPTSINPGIPVDLVVDHSVQIDAYGCPEALAHNVEQEYVRNGERYRLLKWAQGAFKNFRIVPPNSGICHQVNLEYLASVAMEHESLVYCDTVVGTDSHTTMINGLGVLGWGVGGIEAEAAMLGEPYWMTVPKVIGVKLSGKLTTGCTATDLVLTVTQMLRSYGVVGSFVEYFGPALQDLSVADRATVANMSPEYGATTGFFPIDERTIEYLRFTGREAQAELAEAYAKANLLWYDADDIVRYDDVLELDLSSVEPSIAGPSRPQDRIPLTKAAGTIKSVHQANITIDGRQHSIKDGAVAIAAITSCTNTSNPTVMLQAALLAKHAVEKGLKKAPWVKTSCAPGSKVVEDYLLNAGLLDYLQQLGFHIAAYGCTTCIGNSGPLHEQIELANREQNVLLAAALSGNRNFEGRIHQRVGASFLMSPPLVVAYAIAGRMDIDFSLEALGRDPNGNPVYLGDIWPTEEELKPIEAASVRTASFVSRYTDIFRGDERWQHLETPQGATYAWQSDSTYIARPPFIGPLHQDCRDIQSIRRARALLVMADSVTTDHISPAGSIDPSYPAGRYLLEKGVAQADFNSYGSRRGNHEVMVRGTFANIRIKQLLSHPQVGGFTRMERDGNLVHVYDATMEYAKRNIPCIVIAGKEYGTGSSRDWAAKGPKLLGIRAVIAQSFERIHRSNLVGMGILPLQFIGQDSRESLALTGYETFDIELPKQLSPGQSLNVKATSDNGSVQTFSVLCRLDSAIEIAYYRNGGILPYVFRAKAEQR